MKKEKDKKIKIELDHKELSYIIEALSTASGIAKRKTHIKSKHKKYCEKLVGDLAFIAAQEKVMADPLYYFK